MTDRHGATIKLNSPYFIPDAAENAGKHYKPCTVVGFSGSMGVVIREKKIGNTTGYRESTVLPSLLVQPDRVPKIKQQVRRCRGCGDELGKTSKKHIVLCTECASASRSKE